MPSREAYSCIRATEVAPRPRFGTLTILSSETESFWFEITERYAIAPVISARGAAPAPHQTPPRGRPEAALRDVDDPLQRDRVVLVRDHREVRHRVLDLRPLVEPDATNDLVRHALTHEHVLQRPALRVRPVEDRYVPQGSSRIHETQDLRDHKSSLRVVVSRRKHPDALALLPGRPQLLHLTRSIVRHHRVRRVQDRLRRAIVLLQPDNLRLRIVPLEVQDVADVRSAEAVYRLIIIAAYAS